MSRLLLFPDCPLYPWLQASFWRVPSWRSNRRVPHNPTHLLW